PPRGRSQSREWQWRPCAAGCARGRARAAVTRADAGACAGGRERPGRRAARTIQESRRRDGELARPSEELDVRAAPSPRRVLVFLTSLLGAALFSGAAAAQDISINLGGGNGGVTERAIQLIALLTILSLAPSIVVMMTSFTRIVVVLSLLRTALGTATAPPNTVIIALALFLTAFVMGPTIQRAYDDAVKPLVGNQITV